MGPVPATLEVEVCAFIIPPQGLRTDVPIGRIHSEPWWDARAWQGRWPEPRQVTVELNSFAPPIAEAQPEQHRA